MRRKRFARTITAVLAVTLMVSMAVPGLATESAEVQPEEEVVILTGAETEAPDETEAALGADETGTEAGIEAEAGTDAAEIEAETGTGSEAAAEDEETEPEESPAAVLQAEADAEEGVPKLLDEKETGSVVESVTVSADLTTLNVVGQTAQLTAEISPEEAEYDSLTWSSSDTSIAKVNSSGVVTAAGSKDGTATITATVTYKDEEGEDASETGTCKITVSLYNGLKQDPDGTDYYYYKNGVVDTSVTKVVDDTVNGTKGLWNVVSGKLKRAADVVKYNGDWWYFNANGMLDKSYTGFATNSNGSWYMENGMLERDENGVIKDEKGALGSTSDYYYVLNSKVQSDFTGLADYKNASGWWYITKGKVDRTYKGVATNKNGTYYVNKGKVDRSYTGFASDGSSSWYVRSGKVSKTVNGVYKDPDGAIGAKNNWYYVLNSKVQTNFTGLANYKNSSGWWYITKGKVDRSYTGLAKNQNGWFYLSKGKVNRSYTGFAKNSKGDWYVQSGKVTKKYTSLVRDNKGVLGDKGEYYYVSGSKVQYSFTGIASNSNGSWYVKNGKLDRTYNGTYTYNGVKYNVKNGKATIAETYAAMGMSKTMYDKAQTQSSSTGWLILVDVDNCKLGIFKGSYGNWAPYKCWDCSTGASGSPTVRGTYSITAKGYSFGDDDHTCYYYNQFYGNYLIHSILYYPGTFNVKDGRLGMHLSNGCVRLSLDNAHWVYDNVPIGTRVLTY